MTEAEWDQHKNAPQMLEWLSASALSLPGRRLRLLACACAWTLHKDWTCVPPVNRMEYGQVIRQTEMFADGEAELGQSGFWVSLPDSYEAAHQGVFVTKGAPDLVRDIFFRPHNLVGRELDKEGAYGPLVQYQNGHVDTLEFALQSRVGAIVLRKQCFSPLIQSLAKNAYER